MVEKQLSFIYNLDMKEIYNITMEDNNSFVENLDEIKEYKMGEWKGNKRKDNILFDVKEIPDDLSMIKEMLGIDGTIIPLKVKYIKTKDNDNEINIKSKVRMMSLLGNVILKIIKIRIYMNMNKIENNNTKIDVKYTIKTILPKKIMEKMNDIIINKIENDIIIKIDNYLKEYSINKNNG